ncbi:hypothetical protein VNO80_03183 [Phaseolus coccineus]|uniref:P-type ATPase N-terminal domain-containing protein n=1 Tax=Phaseolus coccineus TaxID=3886 RepID=A0AAN9RM88_PHACN
MTRGRIRARLRRSNIYTFGCLKPSTVEEEPHPLQGPGFLRIVYCNQPLFDKKKPLYYCRNDISTTKYNVLTFFPKALFEQFRRVANIYFLLVACLSASPISPFNPLSMISPLAFIVGLSMVKETLEDSCSYEDGISYVETMNLDCKTNLKVKTSLESSLSLDSDEEISLEQYDSKLRNTNFIYGVAIFTSHNSKVMQNSTKSPLLSYLRLDNIEYQYDPKKIVWNESSDYCLVLKMTVS